MDTVNGAFPDEQKTAAPSTQGRRMRPFRVSWRKRRLEQRMGVRFVSLGRVLLPLMRRERPNLGRGRGRMRIIFFCSVVVFFRSFFLFCFPYLCVCVCLLFSRAVSPMNDR